MASFGNSKPRRSSFIPEPAVDLDLVRQYVFQTAKNAGIGDGEIEEFVQFNSIPFASFFSVNRRFHLFLFLPPSPTPLSLSLLSLLLHLCLSANFHFPPTFFPLSFMLFPFFLSLSF